MWCSTCQQDVPGLGSPSSGGELRCGKCGGSLAPADHMTTADVEIAGARIAPAVQAENGALENLLRCPPLPDDDWTLEAELRGVQRLLNSLKSRSPAEESMSL